MTTRQNLSAMISLFGALACSGEGGGSGIPEDEFCPQYAEHECATLAGWCGFTAESCRAARMSACQVRVLGLRSAARHYDGRQAIPCLAKLKEVYRSQPIAIAKLRVLDETCNRVYHGNHQRNEPCTRDNDCQRGLVCAGGRVCSPTPSGPPSASSSCRQIACPAEHYCDDLTGTCRPLATRGQSCATGYCLRELRCRAEICVDPSPLGSGCERDYDCAPPHSFCSPYTARCADGVQFSPGSFACEAQAGRSPVSDAGGSDRRRAADVDVGPDAGADVTADLGSDTGD
jgi:hypothetical protein